MSKSATSSAFVAEINKLKHIQQNLEKDSLIEQVSKLDESGQIAEFYKETNKSRALQEQKVKDNVKQIIVPLRKINNLVTKENIGNIDLKFVKKEMMAIQDNIYSLKSNTFSTLEQLELLEEDEQKFFMEMQVFEQKLQEWSKPVGSLQNKKHTKKVSAVAPENVSQEVKDYMEFVEANGGHENGWTPDDHNLFLKYRNKFKDVNKLAQTIHAILPDISEAEVIAHEEWYQKYIALKGKQRIAIKNWRDSKLSQIKKEPPPKSKVSEQQAVLNSFSECLNKEELQQKIAAWKAKKFREEKVRKEQELQKKLKKEELEKQQRQKYEELKVQVQKWRSTKQDAEEKERQGREMEELREQKYRAARANKLIKQFQTQDEIVMQNKLQSRLDRPKSAELPKTSHVEAKRDPDRLYKPTKQWILRMYMNDETSLRNNGVHYLHAIPKLGTPTWRKMLN